MWTARMAATLVAVAAGARHAEIVPTGLCQL